MVTLKETREDTRQRTEWAFENLRARLRPGQRIYTVLMHTSRSGMYRSIKVLIPCELGDGTEEKKTLDIWDISGMVARVTGRRFDDQRGGVYVQGAGMDMGFEVVYNLGRALHPDGFVTWPGYWRNEPLSFDPDGGYAFKQVWL